MGAGEASKAACEKANDPSLPFEIKANYPLDAQIEDFAYDHATGYKIFYANVNLIDSSVGTVANMVRFRSPSMDVGTSWEMGYTAGQGKPVFGYYDAVPFYGETENQVHTPKRSYNMDTPMKTTLATITIILKLKDSDLAIT